MWWMAMKPFLLHPFAMKPLSLWDLWAIHVIHRANLSHFVVKLLWICSMDSPRNGGVVWYLQTIANLNHIYQFICISSYFHTWSMGIFSEWLPKGNESFCPKGNQCQGYLGGGIDTPSVQLNKNIGSTCLAQVSKSCSSWFDHFQGEGLRSDDDDDPSNYSSHAQLIIRENKRQASLYLPQIGKYLH